MASFNAFRVFVAVYRAGSLSRAAHDRHLTQPAVSAQLAALEARVGEPLFLRTPRGVIPTERGKLLYAQVAQGVDHLQAASAALRSNPAQPGPLRLGLTPEVLHGFALPRLAGLPGAVHVTFGEDRALLTALGSGTLDVALVTTEPEGRQLTAQVVTEMPFALIGPPNWDPAPALPAALGAWLNARPWVSYSVERPVTRRFFTGTLGQRFEAPQALVAPDLRAVVRAVTLGMGASLVPLFAAQEALDAGQVRELWPARSHIPAARWWLAQRAADEARPDLHTLRGALQSRPLRGGKEAPSLPARLHSDWMEPTRQRPDNTDSS
ncbi:LysR family transcriptional regulator [Deinococcus sp.]|uniref:LysR family transcriptional regulator n=1 Tax=Deinococcus sp. TaxID=47478 RepID=UPI0025C4029A|nr:LysR family transcriptional regulator [Deinococcus sp.]